MSKIMISIPDAMLKEIDRCSRDEHRSRSEFFREAARSYIEKKSKKSKLIDKTEVKAALKHMEQIGRKWREDEDTTEIIRRMRDSR